MDRIRQSLVAPFRDEKRIMRLREVLIDIKNSEAPLPIKFNFERLAQSTKLFTDFALKSLRKRDAEEFVNSLLKLGGRELEAFDTLLKSGFDDETFKVWKRFDEYFEENKSLIVKKLKEALAE